MIVEIPIDIWNPARGGLEGYLLRLTRGLLARGHGIRILCRAVVPDAAGRVPLESRTPPGPGQLEVVRIAVPPWPRWLRELAFARKAREIRRAGGADVTLAVRHALEADVYQPHGGPFKTALDASLAGVEPAALREAKRLLRRLRPVNRILLRLDRAILDAPGLVTVSLSGKVEEDFRRAWPGAPLRFERIPNGVDLEEFHGRDRAERARDLRRRLGIPAAARVALFAAHKFGPKGLADALGALPLAPAWHLAVLGGGRPGPFLRIARNLDVAGRVHFLGAVPGARAFHAGADAFVLPTHYDPCSLSVLEALACGTPVVTTTANGAGELMADGREGSIVRPGDRGAIARALTEIGAGWEGFHAACLQRAKGLSFKDHLDRMESVLTRAAEDRRRKGRSVSGSSGPGSGIPRKSGS